MKSGAELITEERQRQISENGYTLHHDSEHENEELARAAMCYAMPSDLRNKAVWGESRLLHFYQSHGEHIKLYPIGWKMKPTPNDRIKELVKAGALIAAEIDRLLIKKIEV